MNTFPTEQNNQVSDVSYGYACINMSLSGLPKSKRVTTNRSMIKRTFKQKGITYASELGLLNSHDLYRILEWNLANGFMFYRLSSNIFPWSSEYRLEDLPDYQEIRAILKKCGDFKLLDPNTQKRVTVENDDKASMWSTRHLFDYIHSQIGIPIVFDYHHYKFCTGGQTEQEALELAMSTWPRDVIPVVHYSQSRAEEHNDPKIRPQAHSDSYWSAPNLYGHTLHVMCECKHKELGVIALQEIIT